MGFGPCQAAVHENQNRAICAYLMLGNAVFNVLAAYHALHAGFHQPFSIEFGSLAQGPTLVRLRVCPQGQVWRLIAFYTS